MAVNFQRHLILTVLEDGKHLCFPTLSTVKADFEMKPNGSSREFLSPSYNSLECSRFAVAKKLPRRRNESSSSTLRRISNSFNANYKLSFDVENSEEDCKASVHLFSMKIHRPGVWHSILDRAVESFIFLPLLTACRKTIKLLNSLYHGPFLSRNIGNLTSSRIELMERDLRDSSLRESCVGESSQVNLDLSRGDATRYGGNVVVSLSRKLRCFARLLFHSLGDLYATLRASTTRECV